MIRKKINVGITGLNNTDNPGPGVPVIRGILDSSAFDSRIIGLAYENLEPGIYMDGLLDKTYLLLILPKESKPICSELPTYRTRKNSMS